MCQCRVRVGVRGVSFYLCGVDLGLNKNIENAGSPNYSGTGIKIISTRWVSMYHITFLYV